MSTTAATTHQATLAATEHPRRWPTGGQARPTPAPPRRAGRVWPPPLLLALALFATACQPTAAGDATPTPATRPSPAATPATSATTDPAVTARDAALAAYQGMWTAYDDAATTANPDDPALATFATGTALATLQRGLRGMRDKDQVGRGRVMVYPTVVRLSPAQAPTEVGIADCADTSAAVLYRREGGPVNNTPGGWRHVDATVIATPGGVWKVSSFAIQAVGSCDGH